MISVCVSCQRQCLCRRCFFGRSQSEMFKKNSFNYFLNLTVAKVFLFSIKSLEAGTKKRESTPDVGFDLIFCVNKSEKKSFHGIFPVGRVSSIAKAHVQQLKRSLIPARILFFQRKIFLLLIARSIFDWLQAKSPCQKVRFMSAAA